MVIKISVTTQGPRRDRMDGTAAVDGTSTYILLEQERQLFITVAWWSDSMSDSLLLLLKS